MKAAQLKFVGSKLNTNSAAEPTLCLSIEVNNFQQKYVMA